MSETTQTHWTDDTTISELTLQLERHPLYRKLDSMNQLRVFMEHHVFAVWDFMSLLKFLQGKLAPAQWPWQPPPFPLAARFVNEIVLAEESDACPNSEGFVSHFQMYVTAMDEVGADTRLICGLINGLHHLDMSVALSNQNIPDRIRRFMKPTFDLLKREKLHEVAAAFALGRERAIPQMFKGILDQLEIERRAAPTLHYYLDRHIAVDEDSHAPLALELLDLLCDNNLGRQSEAVAAGIRSLKGRLRFWDEIHRELAVSRS